MGSGMWSTDTYSYRQEEKRKNGQVAFDYSRNQKLTTPSNWKAHESLSPIQNNKQGNNIGENIREALDSSEHPNSTPISVIFDVTGSMGYIPQVLQQKLPKLHTILKEEKYVEDAQILFGAIGDAYTDYVPLQIGQFESDNRMDEQLENILLEGHGGGQRSESYDLAMYFMARHVDLDANKKQEKGYLFLMGDELPYNQINKHQVKDLLGEDIPDNILLEDIVEELKKKFNVFFFFIEEGHYPENQILPRWQELLGENAMVLKDSSLVAETIALTLGIQEGNVDPTQLEGGSVESAARALASREVAVV